MQFVPLQPAVSANITRSLRRAAGLLRLLSSHTHVGWRLSDLAQQSGLDPATVHRLLAALRDEGLVTRVAGTRRYTLGPMAYELGMAAKPYFELDAASRQRLLALAQELQGTLFVKVRSKMDSVCVARYDGAGTFSALMLDVGGRRPLCLTAGGVAMLIRLPRTEQTDVEANNLQTIAQRDPTRCEGVRQMLKHSRQLGAGVNLGYTVAGISAVSVAVLAAEQVPIAALSLALATPGMPAAAVHALAARLGREAAVIAQAFARLRF